MEENRVETEVPASAEEVWNVLADLAKYPEWNPLLYRADGKLEVGEIVEVSAKTATKDMDFRCTVIKVEPNREFAWKFHVIHPVLFRGVHIFKLEPIDGQNVRFVDREFFKGLLLPTQAKDLTTNGKDAMVIMGEALKERVAQLKTG
jgi:hypothetical protein